MKRKQKIVYAQPQKQQNLRELINAAFRNGGVQD